MATTNPLCEICDAPMRVLTGTGRTPFYCPNDCDRVKRPPCPECGSKSTRAFTWSTWVDGGFREHRAMACLPCGAVFGES